MVSLDPSSSFLSRFHNVFTQGGGRSSQSQSQVAVQSETSTGLVIETLEGDKVTLTTNATSREAGSVYTSQGLVQGQALSLRSSVIEGLFTSQKQVTIEGDLNEEELEDIQEIISQVNDARESIQDGDLDAAIAQGQGITASGTIASVNVKIQHSESHSFGGTFIQQGGGSSPVSQQPSIPAGETGVPVPPTQGGFLQHLLGSTFLNKPDTAQEAGNTSVVPSFTSQTGESEKSAKEGSIVNKLQIGVAQGVQGIVEIFEKFGEEILKGAKKIAKLANRLLEKVEKQGEKIAKLFSKLTEAVSEGDDKKANKLRDKIDRKFDKLEDRVEKITSRINKIAEKIAGFFSSKVEEEHDEDEESTTPPGDIPTGTPPVPDDQSVVESTEVVGQKQDVLA